MTDKERHEWEKNLFEAYKESDDFNKDVKTLIEVIIYENFGERLAKLYKVIDNNKLFSRLIEEFCNNQIEFPSKEDFKESILTAIVYYYHEILNYDWSEIEDVLPYEKDIGLRFSRKLKKVSKNLHKHLNKFTRVEVEKELFDL